MKKDRILFWVPTIIIFLFEGVMPAFTFNTELAKQGIEHLGYPEYFGNLLVVFKIIGVILLVIPKLPKRVKEWVYAGFGFDFIFASLSHLTIDGFGFYAVFPLIFFALLVISYIYFNKLNELKTV